MTRIVVLGGGFGGFAAARNLERLCGGRADITLISRENFFVLTPLLFEASSGRLELRHCAQPIRPALRRARFIEETVEDVDVDRQLVYARGGSGVEYELPYDQLVVALGAETNESLIPGSESAFTFKGMADALALRNHVIERFEAADAALNPGVARPLPSASSCPRQLGVAAQYVTSSVRRGIGRPIAARDALAEFSLLVHSFLPFRRCAELRLRAPKRGTLRRPQARRRAIQAGRR